MLNHDWSVRLMTSVLLLFFFLCAKVLLRDSRFCSDSLIKLPGLEEYPRAVENYFYLKNPSVHAPRRFFAGSSAITANWQK